MVATTEGFRPPRPARRRAAGHRGGQYDQGGQSRRSFLHDDSSMRLMGAEKRPEEPGRAGRRYQSFIRMFSETRDAPAAPKARSPRKDRRRDAGEENPCAGQRHRAQRPEGQLGGGVGHLARPCRPHSGGRRGQTGATAEDTAGANSAARVSAVRRRSPSRPLSPSSPSRSAGGPGSPHALQWDAHGPGRSITVSRGSADAAR